jgi:HK97 family phage prohead protease
LQKLFSEVAKMKHEEIAELQRRAYAQPVELRAAPEGMTGPGTLTGYAVVFNSESRDLGGFTEIISPDAFATTGEGDARSVDTATNGRVIARLNHDSNNLIGTTDAGTLRLFVDEVGVRYEVDLPDTTYARDISVLAARGDLAYSSFAFRTLPNGYTWQENENGALVQVITGAVLVDIAPVADPAYWASTTGLRSRDELAAIRASILKTSDTDTPARAARVAVVGRAREITLLTEKKDVTK